MEYTIALKGLELSKDEKQIFNRCMLSLNRKFVFQKIFTRLSIIIKKHDKNHFYSGQMILSLPKKALVARMREHSVAQIFKNGFEKIQGELEVYKGKHFKSSSKYPNRETIRMREGIGI